jgi:hypothetical protein
MKRADDRSRRRFLKGSPMLGLTVAFSPGTIIEAFAGSKSRTKKEDNNMGTVNLTQEERTGTPTKMNPSFATWLTSNYLDPITCSHAANLDFITAR